MPFEITMPQLGLTMEKGSVIEWLVQEGDPISEGQEIFSVETDKSVVAVEARQAGILARILVTAGQEVPVGTTIAVGTAGGETLPAGWQPSQVAVAPVEPDETVPAPGPAPQTIAPVEGPIQASWKARAMARQAHVDLGSIEGSGPQGRIVAADLAKAPGAAKTAPAAQAISATPVALNLAAALGLDLSGVRGTGAEGKITQSDVLEAAAARIRQQPGAPTLPEPGLPQVAQAIPLKGVHKIVSQGMAHSAHTTARVTLFREVDVSELMGWRERLKAQGKTVSYNDLLVQICAAALREHPEANARLGEGQIEILDRINIGVAVDTDRGLLVPVIHNADHLTTAQIAAESARLVQAAREGRLLPDELSGGTFTITNLGMLGVEGFTPVINLPECCILGVGRIVRKAVVVDEVDSLDVRPMMTLSLVIDHRILDGAPGARFLNRIAELIQDPMLLLTRS